VKPELWQQVRQVLDQAIALEAPQRSPYLDKVCANDPELRREVESLLSSHEQAGSVFLRAPAVDLLSRPPEGMIHPYRSGRRVGVYQILEEIGHGGMGEVYRAARADGQYDKQVAIKLVRGGWDTSFILERFRLERQILAGLDHPNIARLIDGGTTEESIPYLVMELVEGTRIDQYCDAHKLNVTQRLQLFRQVCAAVQYAHQRLVVHRDIKPGNILVTEDGVPKLLDFGIAKILDPSVVSEATLARPMTPEYASPEQIRGETITTVSDVYSLGVVLYELLTGHSPYNVSVRTALNLVKAISETEPERPSVAIFRAAPHGESTGHSGPPLTPESVSQTREGSPVKLRKRLTGDIDNIVLKAVRKESQRRYASVEQLAEDLRRHVEGLPVTARKDSWNYRAGKFVRRHRLAVIATAAVILILIAGVAAIVREDHIATVERARAEKRFNDVRQLSDSLIFDVHDAIQNLPGATPARKLLLDKAVQYLDSVAKDSGSDANLQRELAMGYQRLATVQGDTTQSNLDEIGPAAISNHKAMALFEEVAKANPKNVADQLNVAKLHRALALADVYYPPGRKEINLAMTITDRLMQTDGTNPDVQTERSTECYILAETQDIAGERAQAAESFRKFQALQQDLLRTNPDSRAVRRGLAKASVLLGFELAHMGARQEGLRQMQAGIGVYEDLAKAAADPEVIRALAVSRLRRGQIELMQFDPSVALSSIRQAQDAIAPLAKADPKNTMFQTDVWSLKFDEGRALAISGKYAQAATTIQQTQQAFLKLNLSGLTGPDAGLMLIWLADAQVGMHNPAEALQTYQKAVATIIKTDPMYDDARCQLATAYIRIGGLLMKMAKLPEASAAFNKALDSINLSFSFENQDIPALYPVADAYAGLGDVSTALARKATSVTEQSKQWSDARDWYAKSLSTWQKIPNPAHISPTGFASTTDPREISRRLTECKTKLARLLPSQATNDNLQ
jgi:eukaryotic-like serine/threonine-protein kinase